MVTNRYDQYLRRTNVSLRAGSSVLASTDSGYGTASRLQTVSDDTNTATYSYLDNSSLVGQIAFRRSGTTRMKTTKQYDHLSRLTAISSVPSGASTVSNIYSLNSANQRTRSTLADGSYWAYGFWKELSYNASTALWSNIVVAATGQPSVTGYVFIAKTPEVFQYDADGNLTNDGRWGYSWDAENRLISMRANTALGPQQLIQFEYDSKD